MKYLFLFIFIYEVTFGDYHQLQSPIRLVPNCCDIIDWQRKKNYSSIFRALFIKSCTDSKFL